MTAPWGPDVLGEGFESARLELGRDEEGPIRATLVRHLPRRPWWRLLGGRPPLDDVDVLSVHGWSDYFFQTRQARFFASRGARFYALDLRKYGRSLDPGQTPGYIEDLTSYTEDIDAAVSVIRGSPRRGPGTRRLLLLGHSTGGLVLTLWAADRPGGADGIVLNSPWLELQLTGAGREILTPLIDVGARYYPRDPGPQIDDGFYTRAQHEVGPRDDLDRIDTRWRPARAHRPTAGWLRAVLAGHARVRQGMHLQIPIAVLLSTRSMFSTRWSDDFLTADTVLDVDDTARAALRLGPEVTVIRVHDAIHDVFLSAPHVRDDAYQRLDRWITGWRTGWGRRASGADVGDALGGWQTHADSTKTHQIRGDIMDPTSLAARLLPPPTLAGFGDAAELLPLVTPRRLTTRSRFAHTLVGAFRAPVAGSDPSWQHVEAMTTALAARTITTTDAARLVVVVDAVGVAHADVKRARTLAEKIVSEARFAATNLRGADAFIFGIALTDDDDRRIVAARIREYAWRPIHLGEEVVFSARTLRTRSIRQLLNETFL